VSDADSAGPNATLCCCPKPSPTSPSCPSMPPPLLDLAAIPAGKRRCAATFPHVIARPHSLLSAAACSGCRPPHLSSVFPPRSPSSRECPSTADAGRLPRPRLHHLDVVGECRCHQRLSCRCPCRSAPLPVVQCASVGHAASSHAVTVDTHAPRKRRL
jgi:hypothetical protein